MNDELREAAEDILEHWIERETGGPAQHLANNAIKLAHAYLAEHDSTPITEAWLRSVGFKHKHYQRQDVFAISFKCPIGDPQWIETTELPGAFLLCRMSPMYDDDTPPDRVNVYAPTRGQFRLLARALGITLAENS